MTARYVETEIATMASVNSTEDGSRLYARSSPAKPFHIVQFGKAICTAPLSKRAQYTKRVMDNERMCKNCAVIAGLAAPTLFQEARHMDAHLSAIQRE